MIEGKENAMTTPKHKLPAPLVVKDLIEPSWKSKIKIAEMNDPEGYNGKSRAEFEIWYSTGFGWVIPTLRIKRVSRRAANAGIQTERTYGVVVEDFERVSRGDLVRVGYGPHVLERYTVYVKQSRLKALQPLIDLLIAGRAKAGECRDRISSRRANSAMRRGGIFGW